MRRLTVILTASTATALAVVSLGAAQAEKASKADRRVE